MPPWNPIIGHVGFLLKCIKKLPKDVTQTANFRVISQNFKNSDGLYYIDLWPFSVPMLIVSTPEMGNQVAVEYDLPKPDSLRQFFQPIVGGLGMFLMNGPEWKRSHSLFAPGFAEGVVLGYTAYILKEAEIYVEKLREHARKGDMFSLDDLTCWYMMDVIGTVTL